MSFQLQSLLTWGNNRKPSGVLWQPSCLPVSLNSCENCMEGRLTDSTAISVYNKGQVRININ